MTITPGSSPFPHRLATVGLVCAFNLLISAPLSADNIAVPEDPVAVDAWEACPELPSDAAAVEYRVLPLSIHRSDGDRVPMPSDDSLQDPGDLVLTDRMLIEDERRYREVFGHGSTDMDWDDSRILVIEEFVSYKLGSLDGAVRFSGVYRSGESLIVSQTSTNYGPCQGIAQDPSWYSFEITYLLVVLPRFPVRINYHWCSIGGCPPDIP